MSDSWRPRELQHTRLPCPLLSPGVCSNSCPSSQRCYLTISPFPASFSFCFSLFQHQVFFESALRLRGPKYWSFSFNISPFSEYLEFISFKIDWFDLLAVQGTLKSLLQHHNSKASITLWPWANQSIFLITSICNLNKKDNTIPFPVPS